MTTVANYRELALKNLPPISPMVMRLIGKLARVDVDYEEIGGMIAKDPLLCGQLLRAVNSARYARRSEVHRVEDAILLLGLSKLRKLALSLTVSNLFGRRRTARGWSPLRFNLHSAAVAILSECIAANVRVANGDAIFVAALLHDVGKFAIAVNLPDQYDTMLDMWSSTERSVRECERHTLGFDHAELGGMMLARWELPDAQQRAVSRHHDPELASNGTATVSQVLSTADEFVRYLGISVEPLKPDRLPEAELAIPGMTLPTAKILGDFENEYGELKELFR